MYRFDVISECLHVELLIIASNIRFELGFMVGIKVRGFSVAILMHNDKNSHMNSYLKN